MAKNTRIAFFVICDLACFHASYLLACLIMGVSFQESYLFGFLILIGVKLLAMYVFSVYKILFDYAGIVDFQRVALSLVASTLASVTAAVIIGIEAALTPMIILLSFVFDVALILSVRALYVRQTAAVKGEEEAPEGQSLRRRYAPQKKSEGRVMVIGSQRAAADLITEMLDNESLGKKPVLVVDDDKSFEGDTLLGVEIASGRREIRIRARRQAIDEIYIAKPKAGKKQLAAILRDCVLTNCRIYMLPLVHGNEASARAVKTLADLKKPTIKDLLGRDRPRTDHREIGDQLKGRVVLVTGGAGVFGSELCRRIMRYRPRRLIALDIDEDGLVMLSAELDLYKTDETEFRTVIASVRDLTMMRRAFSAFRPHIVFHAAELKQIPLAQVNPREAFLTNVLGLKTVCDLADEFAAEKFILCSTTRAANPVSVAAECKRTAELYIAEKNEKSQTAFTTVRFPNLIEGRGNVISVFAKQISEGGPLTLTDKDSIRHFISAEEAALLTARAAALAVGGETLEIGPGESIGIRELAEAMIRLSGKTPDEEIEIVVTQLRPGEQLFEDNDTEGNRTVTPAAERIWYTEDKSGVKLPHWSQLWCQDVDRMDDVSVIELLRLIFPTYKSKSSARTSRGDRIENEKG